MTCSCHHSIADCPVHTHLQNVKKAANIKRSQIMILELAIENKDAEISKLNAQLAAYAATLDQYTHHYTEESHAELLSKIECFQKQLKIAREALEFYTDAKSYDAEDIGDVARAALAKMGENV